MIEYIKYFFNFQHLFSVRPQAMESGAVKTLLFGAILLIIIGLVCQVGLKAKDGLTKRGYQKLANLFETIGGLTLVYLFISNFFTRLRRTHTPQERNPR